VAGQGRAALGLRRLRSHRERLGDRGSPIANWTIGRRGREIVAHYRSQGGQVSWQQVPSQLRYAGHLLTGSAKELHPAVDALDADTVPESYYHKVPACGLAAGQSRTGRPA
jgi:hypothetical protein